MQYPVDFTLKVPRDFDSVTIHDAGRDLDLAVFVAECKAYGEPTVLRAFGWLNSSRDEKDLRGNPAAGVYAGFILRETGKPTSTPLLEVNYEPTLPERLPCGALNVIVHTCTADCGPSCDASLGDLNLESLARVDGEAFYRVQPCVRDERGRKIALPPARRVHLLEDDEGKDYVPITAAAAKAMLEKAKRPGPSKTIQK